MRSPSSLHRVLSHAPDTVPRRGYTPSGTRAPDRATSQALAERGPSERDGTNRPAPAGAARADRKAGWEARLVLIAAAAFVAAAGWVTLTTGSLLAAGAAVAGVFLAFAAVRVRYPETADRALATVVAVLLLPALGLIALVVRLSGRGPVLVRQAPADRTGGSEALRFRTSGRTPDGPPSRVGRTLRHLSLDELPRLLDAMRGEMPFLRARHH